MKKIIKYFMIIFASALFMFMLNFNKAEAVTGNFDTSKNTVGISAYTKTDNKLWIRVTVKYTRGFEDKTAQYAICEMSGTETVEDCRRRLTTTDWKSYLNRSTDTFSDKPTGAEADAKPQTKTYDVETDVTATTEMGDKRYVVFVQTFFCSKRVLDSNGHYVGGDGSKKCEYWHDPGESNGITSIEFQVSDVRDTNITNIEDSGLKSMMEKITGIVNDIVMPIIYIVLGLFLLVKGAILGVQIVKAADEPQVRQEKIGSLKWLVIGVAIAYAASAVVHVITAFFSGAFNFN